MGIELTYGKKVQHELKSLARLSFRESVEVRLSIGTAARVAKM
jgi:hypothetical protein